MAGGMEADKPDADGGAKQVKPRLSRLAVAGFVLGILSVAILPVCVGFYELRPIAALSLSAVGCGAIALMQVGFSRGKVRGIPHASGAIVLAVLSVFGTPGISKVRPATPAGTMHNDARWIASAAQQYLIEYQAESVAFVYDPATGEVGDPLRPFVARIAKSYSPVPERLTRTGAFQLGHPEVGVLTFNAEGQIAPAPPGR